MGFAFLPWPFIRRRKKTVVGDRKKIYVQTKLLNFIDTTLRKLKAAGHNSKTDRDCRCSEYEKLKDLEDM